MRLTYEGEIYWVPHINGESHIDYIKKGLRCIYVYVIWTYDQII
jgi:hypothetical protein